MEEVYVAIQHSDYSHTTILGIFKLEEDAVECVEYEMKTYEWREYTKGEGHFWSYSVGHYAVETHSVQ